METRHDSKPVTTCNTSAPGPNDTRVDARTDFSINSGGFFSILVGGGGSGGGGMRI